MILLLFVGVYCCSCVLFLFCLCFGLRFGCGFAFAVGLCLNLVWLVVFVIVWVYGCGLLLVVGWFVFDWLELGFELVVNSVVLFDFLFVLIYLVYWFGVCSLYVL